MLTYSASSVAQRAAAAAVATYPEKAVYHHHCSSGKRRFDCLRTKNSEKAQERRCAAAVAVAIAVVLARIGILAGAAAGVQHYEARKPNSGTGFDEEKLEDIVEELTVFEEYETLHREDSEGLVRPKSL